jgi:methionyl-tRNA formyltransferase
MAIEQSITPSVVFFGTPSFAVAALKALYDNSVEIKSVVTAPDKPSGRGQKLQPSAVKQFALTLNIPVLQPQLLADTHFLATLRALNADIFVVVAFRKLPRVVWSIPPLGTFNLHASLLPQYRGAAPINWAIINGETKTGVTTFLIDENIDTGKLLLQSEAPIYENDDAGELHDRLMTIGAKLVVETVFGLMNNVLSSKVQTGFPELKAAPKIYPETCNIDWHKRAGSIQNLIRGLSPYPAARTHFYAEEQKIPVKIYSAQLSDTVLSPGQALISHQKLFIGTGSNALEILELQPADRKKMNTAAFLNGIKKPLTHAS